ncbi:MAG: hypothetical protein QM493_02530 [Sulfurovum sp.]
MQLLKQTFKNYTKDNNKLWLEIVHCHDKRAYHNLKHLEYIYQELVALKSEIEDFEAIFYAICYHDIIYDIDSKDNEFKSAIFASNRLSSLQISKKTIERTFNHILATQKHQKTDNGDTNLFIDADLSILASPKYKKYQIAIREEYCKYSDEEFRDGRRRVIDYFLNQKRIYHSDYFHDRYESMARDNLSKELKLFT